MASSNPMAWVVNRTSDQYSPLVDGGEPMMNTRAPGGANNIEYLSACLSRKRRRGCREWKQDNVFKTAEVGGAAFYLPSGYVSFIIFNGQYPFLLHRILTQKIAQFFYRDLKHECVSALGLGDLWRLGEDNFDSGASYSGQNDNSLAFQRTPWCPLQCCS